MKFPADSIFVLIFGTALNFFFSKKKDFLDNT